MEIYTVETKEQGFSLIELSISIIIIGFLMAGAITAYQVYAAKQEVERMEYLMTDIDQYLESFPAKIDPATGQPYGRMPFPAPLDGGAAAGDYAVEDPTMAELAPGVYIGKLPTQTLGLRNSYMTDLYGSYLIYAVSVNQTDAATYGQTGAITVQEEMFNPATDSYDISDITGVQYLVLSPGKNKSGAVDFNGVVTTACDTTNTKEGVNCIDFNNPANPANAVFSAFLRRDVEGNEHNDDIMTMESAAVPLQSSYPECDQGTSISVSGTSCPDGWSPYPPDNSPIAPRTGDPVAVGLTNSEKGSYYSGSYYNIDSEGNYYITSFLTPETINNNADPSMAISCFKDQGNQIQTKCINEAVSVILDTGHHGTYMNAADLNSLPPDPNNYDDEKFNSYCPDGYKVYDYNYTTQLTRITDTNEWHYYDYTLSGICALP